MVGKRKRSDSVIAKIQSMKNAAADTLEAPYYEGLTENEHCFDMILFIQKQSIICILSV